MAVGGASLRVDGGTEPVPGERPDADVIEALGRGDNRAALQLCVRRHGAAIGRLCMALLGSQADAEDVLQETLLDAYRGLSSWRAEGSLRAWLLSIARRKCAREIERGQRRRAKLHLVTEVEEPTPQPDPTIRKRAEQARGALRELRPSEREAVVLRFGSGLSYREVSEALGIDEAAARKRVSRGLSALRTRLSDG